MNVSFPSLWREDTAEYEYIPPGEQIIESKLTLYP